jgi:hypothetical protein
VFDVKLQGKVVLKSFDIVAEAGAGNRAVVKEFKGIMAVDEIKLEMVSKAADMKGAKAPIISGMQVLAEMPGPVPPPVLGVMTHNKGSRGFVPMTSIERMTEKQRTQAHWWSAKEEDALQARLRRRGILPEKPPKAEKEPRNKPKPDKRKGQVRKLSPGKTKKLLKKHPEADKDKDGKLSEEELKAHYARTGVKKKGR